MSLSRVVRQMSWAMTALIALIGLTVLVTVAVAQTRGTTKRFTAFAVNLGTPGPASAGTVEIAVTRWSTDAERDRLLAVLMEKGPDKLLDALQRLPRVGYIRTPNSIGYDLHFARRTPLPDGGERVVLGTDRYIGFWEATNRPRSIDYPFTVVEIHINADGEGEGKMSLATKIIADKENKQIVLEDYGTQPVLLKSVRRQPAK
jgi:hypothetical protein